MSKLIFLHQLGEITVKVTAKNSDAFTDENGRIEFTEKLATLLSETFGGQVSGNGVSFKAEDPQKPGEEEPYIEILGDDKMPEDGGVWKDYDNWYEDPKIEPSPEGTIEPEQKDPTAS